MRKNMKVTALMSFVMVLALLISTLAFFSDRITDQKTLTTIAGNPVSAAPADPGTDGEYGTPDDEIIEDLDEAWANNAANENVSLVSFAPGDSYDMSYTLYNNGTLGAKIRETFTVTSTVAMDANNPEFVILDGEGTALRTGDVSDDGLSYKYVVDTETVAAGATSDKDYTLKFIDDAANTFQGAVCTVTYVVEVLQDDGTWMEFDASVSAGA